MKDRRGRSSGGLLPNLLTIAVCLAIAAAVYFLPNLQTGTAPAELTEYSSVSAICELATLRSYYHNVAMYEEKPDATAKVVTDVLFWPFNQLLKTGYKQFWLEYSGVAEIGIDASEIQISAPDARGVVDVYVPDARVLSIGADENSFSQPLDERGFLTSITARERSEAYASAQNAMRQEAQEDQTLLKRAKNNAKLLLEQYIVNVGRETGANYTVNWMDAPR